MGRLRVVSPCTGVSQEVLDRWQDATGGQALTAGVSLDEAETETVELWQWALLILALIVIAESVLANLHLAPRRMESA